MYIFVFRSYLNLPLRCLVPCCFYSTFWHFPSWTQSKYNGFFLFGWSLFIFKMTHNRVAQGAHPWEIHPLNQIKVSIWRFFQQPFSFRLLAMAPKFLDPEREISIWPNLMSQKHLPTLFINQPQMVSFFLIFTSKIGEMIHFDLSAFFKKSVQPPPRIHHFREKNDMLQVTPPQPSCCQRWWMLFEERCHLWQENLYRWCLRWMIPSNNSTWNRDDG